MTQSAPNSESRPFVIQRVVNAPRELVFQAWTDPKHMEWWGPKGVELVHAKMDLRPGGLFLYGMRTADGHEMWGKWVIREVAQPAKLVFVNSFSNAAGGTTRHPMSPDWPLELLSTITFDEQDGKTVITVEWLPLNATPVEQKTFNQGHESMRNGWSGTLEKLEQYLNELQKKP
jgi:uncharacterized protein YndB with AHSA1/START domain